MLFYNLSYLKRRTLSNISNPIMRTGLDFESAQFDLVRGEAEDPGYEVGRGLDRTART